MTDNMPRQPIGQATFVANLDAAEATKLAILSFERFSAHLFCFVFAVTLVLIGYDLWTLGSDLWRYLTRGPATAHVYLGRSAGALAFDLTLSLGLGLALLLGLANARATARLLSSHMARARLGAAVLAVIFAIFTYFQIAGEGQAVRLAAWLYMLFAVPFAHWASMVELVLLVAVSCLLQSQFKRRVATRLSESEAFLLRDDPSQTSRGRAFRTALGVPCIVDFLPSGRIRVSATLVLANVFYATSTLFLVAATAVAVLHWTDALQTCGLDDTPCLEAKALFYLAISVAIAALALFVGPIVGALLSAWSQRQIRFSVEELLKRDQRAPILFLRPFADDQVELPAAKVSFLARVGQWLGSIRNLDSLLLEEGTPYGPVVAIGNPSDRFPPYGAARGYFNDRTWQDAVADLAESSVAIVICVDDFEGVWWEIENVVARHIDKTLLLAHPRHVLEGTSLALLRRVAAKLSPEHRVRLLETLGKAAEQPSPCLGIFVDTDGRLQLATSTSGSRLAFLLQARAFFRGKWGLATGVRGGSR